jgi:hypothetical protein
MNRREIEASARTHRVDISRESVNYILSIVDFHHLFVLVIIIVRVLLLKGRIVVVVRHLVNLE